MLFSQTTFTVNILNDEQQSESAELRNHETKHSVFCYNVRQQQQKKKEKEEEKYLLSYHNSMPHCFLAFGLRFEQLG